MHGTLTPNCIVRLRQLVVDPSAGHLSGHWTHSYVVQRLIRGRYACLCNQQPCSARRAGLTVMTASMLRNQDLASQLRGMSDDETVTHEGCFLAVPEK